MGYCLFLRKAANPLIDFDRLRLSNATTVFGLWGSLRLTPLVNRFLVNCPDRIRYLVLSLEPLPFYPFYPLYPFFPLFFFVPEKNRFFFVIEGFFWDFLMLCSIRCSSVFLIGLELSARPTPYLYFTLK